MSHGPIDYVQLTRDGLRSVITRAMAHIAENGLYGEQHVFLNYITEHPGVVMPEWLRAEYPEDITIVLQHEFQDLAVTSDRFSVTLSFSGRPATLVVPFDAVRAFSDPSAKFSIDIPAAEGEIGESEAIAEMPDETAPMEANVAEGETGTVVSLDAFRKK